MRNAEGDPTVTKRKFNWTAAVVLPVLMLFPYGDFVFHLFLIAQHILLVPRRWG